MSKMIKDIPLSDVRTIELCITKCKKTLTQVVDTACNRYPGYDIYVINGGMWNPDGTPCRGLKSNGELLSSEPWNDIPGFGWDDGPDITLTTDWEHVDNYWATCCLIDSNGPVEKPGYDPIGQGGRRGRSGMGLKPGYLRLVATQDGTADIYTPEEFRDVMAQEGCVAFVMGDGGGSSQGYFNGVVIPGDGRRCHNYVVVIAKHHNEEDDNVRKYKVTPSVGVNIRSGPGTSYSKIGAYSRGTIVTVTSLSNGWGYTSRGWVSMEYLSEVRDTKRITDSGITIRESYISSGRKNRPAGKNTNRYITIHETGNMAAGADADAHASYLDSPSAENAYVSWHYTVDDTTIVQHLPDSETAYHAGDGANGPGNTTSIGIEICVNAGIDFDAAVRNAQSLVRLLMKEHDIPISNVVQHNHWNGKDCPYNIRHSNNGWDAFIDGCKNAPKPENTHDENVDVLVSSGIITAPDYWKGETYSTENVKALIAKTADYIRKVE